MGGQVSEGESILFPPGTDRAQGGEASTSQAATSQEALRDLHLDEVVAAAAQGRGRFELASLLVTPSADEATIRYRQEVSRALEDPEVQGALQGFAKDMQGVHDRAEPLGRLRSRHQHDRYLLEVVGAYEAAVSGLLERLRAVPVRGLPRCAGPRRRWPPTRHPRRALASSARPCACGWRSARLPTPSASRAVG